ncbi:MAG: hypothetical protein F7C34_00605 [Desulfurococcales archaeon]|nr:hypothetical protein [Desulfurococcales archaeon]
MARVVVYEGKGPVEVKLVDGSIVWLCGCGLSVTFPFCSGRHIRTYSEDDDGIYAYDRDGNLLGRIRKIVLEDGREISPESLVRARLRGEEA